MDELSDLKQVNAMNTDSNAPALFIFTPVEILIFVLLIQQN
jgi:hypothetical protein